MGNAALCGGCRIVVALSVDRAGYTLKLNLALLLAHSLAQNAALLI